MIMSLSSVAAEPLHLLATDARSAELKQQATGLRSIVLNERQMCDIELILSGACAPLRGFMCRPDYEHVLEHQRLADGTFFPLPLTLDLPADGERPAPGERLVLRDGEGAMLALMTVEDVWEPDRLREQEILYPCGETTDAERKSALPAVAVGGALEGISLPLHHDFPDLRSTPSALRRRCRQAGLRQVIAVDPESELEPPQHRAIAAMAVERQALVLLQPAVDAAVPTDLEIHRRVRRCRSVLSEYPEGRACLALLPLSTRAGGMRRLLWRALVQRNWGATQMVVNPREQGLGDGAEGTAAVHEIDRVYRGDLGIELLASSEPGCETGAKPAYGAFARDRMAGAEAGDEVLWDGADGEASGLTCFFTGLSGAGKSTVARALASRLASLGRTVSLLDGDLVRRHLSSELTFSKEHRDLNIRRIGYVASEIARHGGIAICAPIAPYRATRAAVREMVEGVGGAFFEIHVATPLSVCEQRDPKGLYAKAHAGLIKDFTGIDDPYEEPLRPEVVVDTCRVDVDAAVTLILTELWRRGGFNHADAAAGQMPAESPGTAANLAGARD